MSDSELTIRSGWSYEIRRGPGRWWRNRWTIWLDAPERYGRVPVAFRNASTIRGASRIGRAWLDAAPAITAVVSRGNR